MGVKRIILLPLLLLIRQLLAHSSLLDSSSSLFEALESSLLLVRILVRLTVLEGRFSKRFDQPLSSETLVFSEHCVELQVIVGDLVLYIFDNGLLFGLAFLFDPDFLLDKLLLAFDLGHCQII